MIRLFIPLTLAACGTPAEVSDSVAADPGAVVEASAAIQLDGIIALTEQTKALIPVDEQCPRVTQLQDDETVLHVRLDGDCTMGNGQYVTGHVEHYEGPDGMWLIGSDFQLTEADALIFGLDGAVEITPTGSLWLVDVAAALCGTQNWSCEDGVLALDLNYTVFPASGPLCAHMTSPGSCTPTRGRVVGASRPSTIGVVTGHRLSPARNHLMYSRAVVSMADVLK